MPTSSHHLPLLTPNVVKAGVSTGAASAVQTAMNGTIEVDAWLYTLIAVILGLVGVFLARLVTIDAENKKLGRVQTLRETGPLTWIGVLIVCPFIWHFQIDIPWASMIGLGVGYSVRIVLKIFGGGAVGAARAIARRAADALDDEQAPPPAPSPPALLDAPGARPPAVMLAPDHDGPDGPARRALLDQLDQVPDRLPRPPEKG